MTQIIEKLELRHPKRLLCSVLDFNRSTLYKKAKEPTAGEITFRAEVKQIALKRPTYGYRRVAAQQALAHGKAQYKKVYSILKEENLFSKRKRKFIKTTDSNHNGKVFPNLVPHINVERINQIWATDITYCAIDHKKFAYLAVIMDVYSRKVIGWNVSMNIDAQLCVNAFQMALENRKDANLSGLTHHSDRGVQYASQEYTQLLAEHAIRGSMSRKGNPYDNAFAESFFKTFKYEGLYRSEQQSFSDIYNLAKAFIEDYNRERLHSSIGYIPPDAFEEKLKNLILIPKGAVSQSCEINVNF